MLPTENMKRACIIAVLICSCAWPGIVAAEQDEGTSSSPQQFDSSSTVQGQIESDDEARALVSLPFLDPYFDFKQRLDDKIGLSFGLDYNAMFQYASESLNEDLAASGVVRLYGTWALFGRKSGNTGSFVFKVENRHGYGTGVTPQDFGGAIGYAGITGMLFSDIGWALTNLYWHQEMFGGRAGLVIGVVDPTDYLDLYSMINAWIDFENLAFSTNPTIAAPNQGLGMAASAILPINVYLIAGIADANAAPTRLNNYSSFFTEHEYFTHFEIGWVPSYEERYFKNVHLTFWHADGRTKAGIPSGWGLAFTFNWTIGEKWEPFVRAGYSDGGGAFWNKTVSIGFGRYMRGKSDVFGLGLNWSRPSEDVFGPGLNDQYTAEVFYRLKVFKTLTIAPDVQLIVNPALNPDHDVIVVAGARARVNY